MYRIYNEDCIIGVSKLPDSSVDFILTDLPYGTTDAPFDKRIPFEPMWEQFLRVTKENAAIALFSQMPFGAELIMSQPKLFRYEWIWEKSNALGFLNSHKMPLRAHENILVFYRKLPTYNPQFTEGEPYSYSTKTKSANYQIGRNYRGNVFVKEMDGKRYPRDVLFFTRPPAESKERRLKEGHPQQKPVALLEYLIVTYTNEGETVLDATMGSGSTGVACVNKGRRFVGFETEKRYYKIAQKRIGIALAEKRQELFFRGDYIEDTGLDKGEIC